MMKSLKGFTIVEAAIILTIVVILVVLVGAALSANGCSSRIKTGETTKKEMEQTERNHERLVAAVPPPMLNDSLERRNLKKRLELFNDANKVSYIYLISRARVMAFFPIKGKVTYAGSKLTTREQIVTHRSLRADNTNHAIESPGLDGSYGPSEEAIFFWTTEGVYIEWRGDYLLCDAPLKLATEPDILYIKNLEE